MKELLTAHYVTLLFEPHDLWIGVYWNREPEKLMVYIALLPMIVLRVMWKGRAHNQ